jgi:putative AdoMet-dependent methyltransferase
MLDNEGFDLWADEYDQSVQLSEKSERYPFAAYKEILNEVYQYIKQKSTRGNVLDIGFGTGTLTKKLYDDGYRITGIDFSPRMIEIAKNKMPNAKLFQCNFVNGLPLEIIHKEFNFIICTYAIHHLNDYQKRVILGQMLNCLNSKGYIIIGDIMTKTENDMLNVKEKDNELWDDGEYYLVAENVQGWFRKCDIKFIKKILLFWDTDYK